MTTKKATTKKPPQPKLYKTLSATGSSIHGGNLQWSLPKGGKPGAWHEIEGEIEKCCNGLHLTDEPARWWQPGCRVFEVAAEGVEGEMDSDRKVVCRRARLVRELVSESDLAAVRIYVSGEHRHGDGHGIATGSSRVEAWGSSRVEAWDSSRVEARDSSSVVAWDSSRVVAWDSSSVVARDYSSVEAWDSSSVVAWDSSRVVAWGSSRVVAWDSSSVVAWGSSRVVAWDSSRVEARDSSRVEARDSVTVISWKGKPGAKIVERVVWIDRSNSAPVVYTAATEVV